MIENIKKQSGVIYKTKLYRVLGKLWSVLFLLFIVGVFSIRGVNFFRIDILQNVLLAATLIMLVGIGETLVVISGGIDISPSYVVGLSAGIGAIMMRRLYMSGFNEVGIIIIGILSIFLFSSIPGLINGLIITKLKVAPFIVTIGTMSIAEGIVYLLNNGMPIINQPPLVGKIGNAYLFYYVKGEGISFTRPENVSGSMIKQVFPVPVLILLIFVLIIGFILAKTVFGLHIYAIGGNVDAARLSGVPVDLELIKVYMIASIMYGMAGMVYLFRFSTAAPNAGEPLLMSSLAAVFIGGASMAGGYGSVAGTVIGALIIAILQTGLVMSGVSSFWQYIAVGFVIIIAVLFDNYKSRLLLT